MSRDPWRKHSSATKEEGGLRRWSFRIFHTLHHRLTERPRALLIETEITSEARAMRCRHAATSLPPALRKMRVSCRRFSAPGGLRAWIAWFDVFSRCCVLSVLDVCLSACLRARFVSQRFSGISLECGDNSEQDPSSLQGGNATYLYVCMCVCV